MFPFACRASVSVLLELLGHLRLLEELLRVGVVRQLRLETVRQTAQQRQPSRSIASQAKRPPRLITYMCLA
jgi:hypothetical protein